MAAIFPFSTLHDLDFDKELSEIAAFLSAMMVVAGRASVLTPMIHIWGARQSKSNNPDCLKIIDLYGDLMLRSAYLLGLISD